MLDNFFPAVRKYNMLHFALTFRDLHISIKVKLTTEQPNVSIVKPVYGYLSHAAITMLLMQVLHSLLAEQEALQQEVTK